MLNSIFFDVLIIIKHYFICIEKLTVVHVELHIFLCAPLATLEVERCRSWKGPEPAAGLKKPFKVILSLF
jgi:hypothetical protein